MSWIGLVAYCNDGKEQDVGGRFDHTSCKEFSMGERGVAASACFD